MTSPDPLQTSNSNQKPSVSFRSMPKPKKSERLGIIRRKHIAAQWPEVRDERKRETQNPDGSWTCFYCNKPIWTWEECVIGHKQPKGRRPELKLLESNLEPCHAACNLTSDPNYSPNRQ